MPQFFSNNDINSKEKDELVKSDKQVTEPDNKQDFILTAGDRGKKVRVVQFAIGVRVDGIFGSDTLKALKEYRGDSQYAGNGDKVSAMEYDSLHSSIGDLKHIKVARSYVGQIDERDVDGDGVPDNRSPQIDKMTKYVFEWFNVDDEDAKGYPWCAIFISYVMKTAYPSWDYKSAKVIEWLSMMQSTGGKAIEMIEKEQFRKDKVYIGCWVNSNGFGHIFFVDPYKSILIDDRSIVSTIEGNTNDGGSREGNGVYERQRYFNASNKIKIFELTA